MMLAGCLRECSLRDWYHYRRTPLSFICDMTVVMPEFCSDCPWYTRALVCICFFFDGAIVYLPAAIVRYGLRERAKRMICCYYWMACDEGYTVVDLKTRQNLKWCRLVSAGDYITSFIVYRCMAFPSRRDVWNVAMNEPQVPEWHVLENTCTCGLESEGRFLILRVRRFDPRRIWLVYLLYVLRCQRCLSEVFPQLKRVAGHLKASSDQVLALCDRLPPDYGNVLHQLWGYLVVH